MARETVCTHTPHHARSLCRACSDLAARGIHECPPTVPPEACEATEAAMQEVPISKKMGPRLHPSTIEPKAIKVEQVEPAFNTADPKVSDFIAGAVVKNLLSYPAAVRQLKPDLPPVQQATLAYQLE